uniref:CARD domain-containing protein n=1 Tax=Kryptolebias marmoratus TaxID=37003 RepID=A0A3Q3GX71_KRYMA
MADKEIAQVRGRFVEKVSRSLVKQLLDDMLEDGVLNDQEKDSVLEDNTSKADMARDLIDTVKRKGDKASRKMIDRIQKRDPMLYLELGLNCEPLPGEKPRDPLPQNQTWSSKLITTTDSFKKEKLGSKDVYNVTQESLGNRMALLITNRDFADARFTRKGAEKDEENMVKLLSSLRYSVEKHKDLTGKEMDEVLCAFTKQPKLKTTDSFPVDNIYKYLGSQNCPALIDKPKIIIIQACRGESQGHVLVSDSAKAAVVSDDVSQPASVGEDNIVDDTVRFVHKEKDFISLLSSTPDTVSYRREDLGSFLIQYIVEVFNTCSHVDDIDELFRKVSTFFLSGAETSLS